MYVHNTCYFAYTGMSKTRINNTNWLITRSFIYPSLIMFVTFFLFCIQILLEMKYHPHKVSLLSLSPLNNFYKLRNGEILFPLLQSELWSGEFWSFNNGFSCFCNQTSDTVSFFGCFLITLKLFCTLEEVSINLNFKCLLISGQCVKLLFFLGW